MQSSMGLARLIGLFATLQSVMVRCVMAGDSSRIRAITDEDSRIDGSTGFG